MSKREQNAAQMELTLDSPQIEALPGLQDYTPAEAIEAELEVAGIDASAHMMEHKDLFFEVAATPAADLTKVRNDTQVWIAGVKVASQTPAIRSGQRIISITLDDVTGPIDVAVFERAQPAPPRTSSIRGRCS